MKGVKILDIVGIGATPTQEKTVTASREQQIVTPDDEDTHLSQVTVEPFPDANGTYTYPTNSTGGTYDMGVDNNLRYVNATNVYNKGYADGNDINYADQIMVDHLRGSGTLGVMADVTQQYLIPTTPLACVIVTSAIPNTYSGHKQPQIVAVNSNANIIKTETFSHGDTHTNPGIMEKTTIAFISVKSGTGKINITGNGLLSIYIEGTDHRS
jgi:hypothetical protein